MHLKIDLDPLDLHRCPHKENGQVYRNIRGDTTMGRYIDEEEEKVGFLTKREKRSGLGLL